MANNKVDLFILPRLDWYDKKGRINKDALIENFNALEEKLLEVSELSAISTEIPDISKITFEDVTLDSPDNKIINLRSFLTICPIIGYPLELNIDGKKIKKISYYKSDFTYKTLNNIVTNASNNNKFIFLDYANDIISTNSNPTVPNNSCLIGAYIDNKIWHLNSNQYANINILQYLSKMKTMTYSGTYGHNDRSNNAKMIRNRQKTRFIGKAACEKKSSDNRPYTFRDVGIGGDK